MGRRCSKGAAKVAVKSQAPFKVGVLVTRESEHWGRSAKPVHHAPKYPVVLRDRNIPLWGTTDRGGEGVKGLDQVVGGTHEAEEGGRRRAQRGVVHVCGCEGVRVGLRDCSLDDLCVLSHETRGEVRPLDCVLGKPCLAVAPKQ